MSVPGGEVLKLKGGPSVNTYDVLGGSRTLGAQLDSPRQSPLDSWGGCRAFPCLVHTPSRSSVILLLLYPYLSVNIKFHVKVKIFLKKKIIK